MAVFPIFPGKKTPLTEHGFKDATKDPATIGEWWAKWPDANVGIATGAVSRIFVVDVDPRHSGNDTIYELQLEFGKLPDTRMVRTGGGGTHFYFKHPGWFVPNSSGRIGPGVDVRGDRGYVLAPPSITNGPYEVLRGENPLEAPGWLFERLKHGANIQSGEKTYRQPVFSEGQRNLRLTSLAGALRRAGLAESELLAALQQANADRCAPPLPADEVKTIAKSVSRYDPSPQAEENGHGDGGSKPVSWEKPIPFAEHDASPFPAAALPEWLGSYVTAVATSTQTPIDLAAMLSLSVLATAVATKARIALADDWSEPLNLFTAVVLPPGSRKSAVFSAITEPVEDFEREEAERSEPQQRGAADAYEVAQASLKHAKEAAAKANDEKRARALEEVGRLSNQLAEMKVPAPFRLLADDCTPEKLSTLLRDHDGRMALLSPEGGVFELMAGRYSDGPNLEVYLKGHAGDDLRVDRINRPPEFVRRPALTIGLAIQPDVLQGLKDKPGFRGRGLLGRFLYALPRNTVGCREIDPPSVPPMVRAIYQRELRILLSLPEIAHVLRLSAEARKRHRDFMRELEPRLGPTGDLAATADWAAKLAGAVGRLAGLLHLAEIRTEAAGEEPISAETMDRALSIGRYLILHAQTAFAEMGADPETEGAQRILAWLKRTGMEAFTKRDAHQALRATFRRAADLDAPLTALEERGYIRPLPEVDRPGAGRKRSPAYEVHPLLSQSSEYSESARRTHFEDSEYSVQGRPALGRTVGWDSDGGTAAKQSIASVPPPPAPTPPPINGSKRARSE